MCPLEAYSADWANLDPFLWTRITQRLSVDDCKVCDMVCKSWHQDRCQAAQHPLGNTILFCNSTSTSAIARSFENGRCIVYLDFGREHKSLVDWIMKRAASFSKLEFEDHSPDRKTWLSESFVPDLFVALRKNRTSDLGIWLQGQLWVLCFPDNSITVLTCIHETGESPMLAKAFHDMLKDRCTDLCLESLQAITPKHCSIISSFTHLTRLCLSCIRFRLPQAFKKLEKRQTLASLSVKYCSTVDHVLNLGHFRALTCLQLSMLESTTILLPLHQQQSLQRLCIYYDCTLRNLATNSALTELELTSASLSNVLWPTSLLRLQDLRVHNARGFWSEWRIAKISALPAAWQHYTALRHIEIPAYCAKQIPVWFSSLRQLEVLSMPDAMLGTFSTDLLKLTRLEKLNLDNLNLSVNCDILLYLADLPALTYLSLQSNHNRSHSGNVTLVDLDIIARTAREECLPKLEQALRERVHPLLPGRPEDLNCAWYVSQLQV